jgi:hypothetical protein
MTTTERKKSPLSFGPVVSNLDGVVTCIYPVVLLEGHVPTGPKPDGTLTVRNPRNQTPATTWPVLESRFKALVHLRPGINVLHLDYVPSESRSLYQKEHRIKYEPMVSSPPIKLVMFHAKDSPYAESDDLNQENTLLLLAKAKYRMSAYLWQSFMAENMTKLNHGRRTFQLENSWEQSTLYAQDLGTSEARNQAPVHVIQLSKTVAELAAMSQADMPSYLEAALEKRFRTTRGRVKSYFACLMLDSEWDHANGVARGSVSYAGQGTMYGNLNMAVMGGHSLSTLPASIDQVTSALSDNTPTPNLPESVRSKCASAAMGFHLQLIGKMLGLPEQNAGLMADGFKGFGANFSIDTDQGKEAFLHGLDAVRLRFHPVFHAPWGPGPTSSSKSRTGLTICGTADSAVEVRSRVGISAIEIYKPKDTVCQHWLSYFELTGSLKYTVDLTMNGLTNAIAMASYSKHRGSLRKPSFHGPFTLKVLTADGNTHTIPDIEEVIRSVKTPSIPELGRSVFANVPIGTAPTSNGDTVTCTAIFPRCKTSGSKLETKRMLCMTIFHTPGLSVSGVEFTFDDKESVLLGSRGEDAHKEWHLDEKHSENLVGMEVNVSQVDGSLCGLRAHTSWASMNGDTSSRISPWFGSAGEGTTS